MTIANKGNNDGCLLTLHEIDYKKTTPYYNYKSCLMTNPYLGTVVFGEEIIILFPIFQGYSYTWIRYIGSVGGVG